jgi:hypothetical protein
MRHSGAIRFLIRALIGVAVQTLLIAFITLLSVRL